MAPFVPIVCVVGFHHARGPEIENWFGVEDGSDPALENEWPLLPFMALADGAHSATEDFSYFTLRHADVETETIKRPATSLFGIACTRQLDSRQLKERPAEVTRSTVQKAVVVISDSPHHFGQLREKLSIVTKAWFAQKDFTDIEILQKFQESLVENVRDQDDQHDQYFGLPLRELIHEFKHQTLVLFKCCLLQPKMLFFGSQCERVCLLQFSLISLIPGLLRHLEDCADPQLNSYEEGMVRPTSLRTSERGSLLTYMGLPLQIFGQGSLFGPYTPLQQLDILADKGTKSYIVGSTNSLLLQQKDRYSDILINLDDQSVNISSTSLRAALTLSTPDRRWIDFLTQSVNDTWDEANPERPNTMGYVGSEEFIRLQFEEYLLALVSAVKYRTFLQTHKNDPNAALADIQGDPANDFGSEWVDAWMRTENFRLFNTFTDSHIFDITDPTHPCSGGLTVEDVQRRLAQQVSELHLDEKFQSGKEVLGKHLATGQQRVSTAFNTLWADIEKMREAQRQRAEEQRAATAAATAAEPSALRVDTSPKGKGTQDTSNQPGVSAKASAYLSSWGSWAAEKRKTGWGRSAPSTPLASPLPKTPIAESHEVKSIDTSSMSKASDEESLKDSIPEPTARPAILENSKPATAPPLQKEDEKKLDT